MTEFGSQERKRISRLFDVFEDKDIEYVVPRGYTELPSKVPGNDVDLIVAPHHYDHAKKLSMSVGFEDRSVIDGGTVGLLSRVTTDPISTVRFAINSPRNTTNIIRETVFSTEKDNRSGLLSRMFQMINIISQQPRQTVRFVIRSPDKALKRLQKRLLVEDSTGTVGGGLSSIKLRYGDVTLHYANHLVYESPMDGSMVRVDPQLERFLFEERVKTDGGFYVPSPPDELLHLLCRGLFDYNGAFPDYYVTKCRSLWDQISSDRELDDTFRERLRLAFFSADELVYRYVQSGDYDDLYEALIRYDAY